MRPFQLKSGKNYRMLHGRKVNFISCTSSLTSLFLIIFFIRNRKTIFSKIQEYAGVMLRSFFHCDNEGTRYRKVCSIFIVNNCYPTPPNFGFKPTTTRTLLCFLDGKITKKISKHNFCI